MKNFERIKKIESKVESTVLYLAVSLIFEHGRENVAYPPYKNILKRQAEAEGDNNFIGLTMRLEIIELAYKIANRFSLSDILTYYRIYSTGNEVPWTFDSISKERLNKLLCNYINNEVAKADRDSKYARVSYPDVYEKLEEAGFTVTELNQLGFQEVFFSECEKDE